MLAGYCTLGYINPAKTALQLRLLCLSLQSPRRLMSLFYAKPRPKIIVLALNYGFLFATATVATDTFMSPINDFSLLLRKLSVEVFET